MYNSNTSILLFFNYYGVLEFFSKRVSFSLTAALDIESNGICPLYTIESTNHWLVGTALLTTWYNSSKKYKIL